MPATQVRTEARVAAPSGIEATALLDRARAELYKDPNVIGVGIGERRKRGAVQEGDISLVVYVKEKRAKSDVAKQYLVPEEIGGLATDVVAPFSPEAPAEALGIIEGHHHSDDMFFVDWPRLHEQWTAEAGGEVEFHGIVEEFGDVCAIQDDGTLVQTINGTQQVDWVRAYKLFRTTHPDIYDFVTFFTDTAAGMPPQGGSSWYRFVYNDVNGIGFGPFDQRAAYGSSKLQGIMFLNQGHFPAWRYVMLQEQAHRFAAFAPYRDTSGGPNMTDHMLSGWGHWELNFDDDRSPMDYDIYDWVAEGSNYRRISLTSDQRTYSDLDLYLMGLLGPEEVGDFYLLGGVTPVSGNLYSATKKRLTAQNIIWANGARTPTVGTSQKLFKNAFVVLTKDLKIVHDLVDTIDFLRLKFERDFYEATKTLGRVDTTLGPLRRELTPSEVVALTSGGYTGLHRHSVTPSDLQVRGVQWTGSINPGETKTWFTFNWSPNWFVEWQARPTTAGGKLTSDVAIERSSNGTFTYHITVRNVGPVATSFEGTFVRLR